MKMYLHSAAVALVSLAATCASGAAATLDDVMARLDSLQRDNQNLHRDNQAMRKEIAALRKERSTAVQAVGAVDTPRRPLAPAASSAMAAYPVKAGYVEPPQGFSWNGFYLGLHAGYGWGSNNWTFVDFIQGPGVTAPVTEFRKQTEYWEASKVAQTTRPGCGSLALRPSSQS